MAQTTGQNLPVPQSPFVNPDRTLSNDGYQYLLSQLAQAAKDQATATVDTGLKSTGANQATALQLSSQWNEIDTVPAGTGVLLEALQPGQSQVVFNASGTNLNVYPPPGSTINALAINDPFVLGGGLRATFEFFTATKILT